MVWQWRRNWKQASNLPTFTTTWSDYLQQQIDAMNLDDSMVDTIAHDDLPNRVSIKEMIQRDLRSYG